MQFRTGPASGPKTGTGPAKTVGARQNARPYRTDAAFLDTISRMKAPRRRDGATFWRVYKDLGEPSRYVERFIVASWAGYLHQRARATLADQALETEVRAFLAPGETARMSHYIAER